MSDASERRTGGSVAFLAPFDGRDRAAQDLVMNAAPAPGAAATVGRAEPLRTIPALAVMALIWTLIAHSAGLLQL